MSLQLIYSNLYRYFISEADIPSSTLIIDERYDTITIEFFVNESLVTKEVMEKIAKNRNISVKLDTDDGYLFHVENQIYKIVDVSVFEASNGSIEKEFHVVLSVCTNFLHFLEFIKPEINSDRYKELENLDTLILTKTQRGYYDKIKFKNIHLWNSLEEFYWGCPCPMVVFKLQQGVKFSEMKDIFILNADGSEKIPKRFWFEWRGEEIHIKINSYINQKQLWTDAKILYGDGIYRKVKNERIN